jgi:branched-chain amino acid transport system permease protein
MAIVLDGIVFGLQLALLGVGMTLVFGLGGVLNLAHGQLVVVAALLAATLIGSGWSILPAVALAIAVAAGLAVAIERTLMRPVYARRGEVRVVGGLLVTLAFAFVIDGLAITLRPFTALHLRVDAPAVTLLGVPMRASSLLASSIALVALALLAGFLRLSRAGKAIRSVIQDEVGAQLCGISPPRVRTAVWALSGGLAGLVAVTQGLNASVGATAGFDLTILALIVAVVGGLGRVSGTVSAALLLGVVHAVATHHVGAFVTIVILLAAAVVAIVVRPSGLAAPRSV